jgi:hypothetical protein
VSFRDFDIRFISYFEANPRSVKYITTVSSMDEKRELLRHFLAALAYRTQKALRGLLPSSMPSARATEYAPLRNWFAT